MTTGSITSIHALLHDLLREQDRSALGTILQRYTGPSQDLQPYCNWNQRHYTRTCIHRNDQFELLVICYEAGQRTSIHDYDSQTAWIQVVMGDVVEERFTSGPHGGLDRITALQLLPGQVDSIPTGQAIHRFINNGPGRAITLNLYAKPMNKWRVYDERTGLSSIAPAGPLVI